MGGLKRTFEQRSQFKFRTGGNSYEKFGNNCWCGSPGFNSILLRMVRRDRLQTTYQASLQFKMYRVPWSGLSRIPGVQGEPEEVPGDVQRAENGYLYLHD